MLVGTGYIHLIRINFILYSTKYGGIVKQSIQSGYEKLIEVALVWLDVHTTKSDNTIL